MKIEVMKTVKQNIKVPTVTIDLSPEQYRHKIFFPEKLAITNEVLKIAKLPKTKHPLR